MVSDSPQLTTKDEIRFYSSVASWISDPDRCWEWKKSRHKFGYGWFRISGKTYTAHRIALFLHTGIWGDKALHSCDNPPCCNPHHLRWGTDADNVHDAMRRGRHTDPPRNGTKPPVRYGESNNKAIMTKDKVVSLRKEFEQGGKAKDLAISYGISRPTVWQIVKRKTWKDV